MCSTCMVPFKGPVTFYHSSVQFFVVLAIHPPESRSCSHRKTFSSSVAALSRHVLRQKAVLSRLQRGGITGSLAHEVLTAQCCAFTGQTNLRRPSSSLACLAPEKQSSHASHRVDSTIQHATTQIIYFEASGDVY